MSDERNDTGAVSNTSRRTLLAGLSVAGAAYGLSGLAAGESSGDCDGDIKARLEEYRDLEVVWELLEEREELLDAAYEAGFIEEPTVEALGLESMGNPESPEDPIVTVDAKVTPNGVTPRVRVTKPFHRTEEGGVNPGTCRLTSDPCDEGRLDIVIKPEVGGHFEVWHPFGDDDVWELIKNMAGYCGSDCDCGCEYGCRRSHVNNCSGRYGSWAFEEYCPC